MKNIYVLIAGIFFSIFSVKSVNGQSLLTPVGDSLISPIHLSVTYNKTSNLVFPFAIKTVDRGSKDILAQKAKGVENILQVKAAKIGFDETNLTVITVDGNLYSYILNYSDTLSVLNINVASKKLSSPDALFSSGNALNDADIRSDAETVLASKRSLRNIKDKSYGIYLRLDGLYIHEDVMYFKFRVANRSNINYDIEQLRLFIRDQKKAKRTAIQELEIHPLQIYNEVGMIPWQSRHVFVYAVPKFTIPDKKFLSIQMTEKNGGRHLQLRISNKVILKVKPLSDLQ